MAALTTLAWLISSCVCVASVLTDTTATGRISIGSPASAQQAALTERPAVSSESDSSNDSVEDDDDGCVGAHGSNDKAWACDEEVDLGELADRVADALLGIDAQERGVLGSRISIPSRSPTSRTGVEADASKVCGEEYLKMCSKGDRCCNSSCLQIACGELTRGGGPTKSTLGVDTGEWQQSRLKRQEALVSSMDKDPSIPPKDRLESLQLHVPELFAHVSLKGFKRLISQITHGEVKTVKHAGAIGNALLHHGQSNHAQELRGSSEGVDTRQTPQEEEGTETLPENLEGDGTSVQQGGSKIVMRGRTVVIGTDGPPPSDSSQLNRGARKRQRVEAHRGDSISRVTTPSSGLRSTPGTVNRGGGGGGGGGGGAQGPTREGAAMVSGDGDGVNTVALAPAEGRHQQQHGFDDASMAEVRSSPETDTVPVQCAAVSRGSFVDERDGSLLSLSSKQDKLSNEGEAISAWGVGQPVTGLADVDITSTMNGLLEREISEAMQEESDRLGRERAAVIRAAMDLLWKGYSEHAWGYDEVKPLSKKGSDNWGGMGVTLVDSLDTLWLMGLTEEFYNGRDWVRDHLTFHEIGMVSVFETTIRVLGGLLSAFELSREEVFLERAKDLADRLMPAFGTSTGIPYKLVNLSNGKTGGGSYSVLSELGTLQLEFRYLSHAVGDEKYARTVMRAFDFLAGRTVPHGLYPIRINPNTGKFTSSQVTFGALGDSFYEYLLKVWMQGGRREESYRRMYEDAMDGVEELLVQKARGLTYLSEWNGTRRQHRMDHLACFLAGNLALGAMTSPDSGRAARDLRTGKALAYTCYQMYLHTATGLSPEVVEFNGSGDMKARDQARFYILRPETLESFFVLHQLTGDPVYREWGWEIFRAIERHCRIGVAYGSFPDVEKPGLEAKDHMESFFPGETLKYLYLLMQPDHPIDLMEYTLNTEAHPLKIFAFDDAASGRSQILA